MSDQDSEYSASDDLRRFNLKVFYLAVVGGVVTFVGKYLIGLTHLGLFNLLALYVGTPTFWPTLMLPKIEGMLLDFLAGFLAVYLVVPLALRRSRATTVKNLRRLGAGYGALTGLTACLLLAFLHVTLFFVVAAWVKQGPASALQWGTWAFPYIFRATLLYGVPAAFIGAVAGIFGARAFANTFLKPIQNENRPTNDQTL